jgi:hypothetical protein
VTSQSDSEERKVNAAAQRDAPDWLFGPSRGARARRALVLILFPALVLSGTLGFDFVFDDTLVILEDPLVTGPFDAGEIFGSQVRVGDVPLGYFRPLITLLYRLDFRLWGSNPAGYHLTNLLWHLSATVLLYQVAIRTVGAVAAAWAAAMVFAVLPAHTEAIGWVQGRTEVVSTALVLFTLLALVQSHGTDGGAAPAWWAVLAGCGFLAALLAKESAMALPLIWAVWEVSEIRRGSWRKRLPGLACRFGVLLLGALGYLILRRHAVGAVVGLPLSLSPLGPRVLGLLAVLAEYGRTLLIPGLTLNLFQALPDSPLPWVLLLCLAMAGVLAGGFLAVSGWGRPALPWAAWTPTMLLPALIFVWYAPAPERGFYAAERLLYLPSVGWCVLLGGLLAALRSGRREADASGWGLVTMGGLLVGYAALTLIRLVPWSDAAGLYVAMQAQPRLPQSMRVLVHNNLGQVYLERDQFPAARAEFLAALRLQPDYALAYNNLGVLLVREGKPEEARPWLESAIRLNPSYAAAYGNLGAALEAAGNLSAARAAYEAGMRVAPGSARLAQGLERIRDGNPRVSRPRTGRAPGE